MIIESNSKLTSTGDSTYKIEISGKTFRGLFGDLYANPLKSMIREIVANAHDANRCGGYEGPVEISINKDGPDCYIEIKDHGIGMTHDDMVNMYTTFFRSTKDNSNEDIGGFGIGSKSPLAYADYFIATSVKDGKKNIIVTSKNDDIPSYEVMLKDVETSEGNGTTIRIPVKESDEQQIIQHCTNDLVGFKPIPTLNVHGKDIKPYDVYEIVEGLRIIPAIKAYRLSFVSVGGPIYRESINAIAFNGAMILDVPISDVRLSLSRESIARDDKYIQTVNKLVEQKAKEVVELIKGMSREELLSSPWAFALTYSSNNKEIFLSIIEKLGLNQLKVFKHYFHKTTGTRSRDILFVSGYTHSDNAFYGTIGSILQDMMDSEYLNFAREELRDQHHSRVPASCYYEGITFFTDAPEQELIELAESLGKKCRIMDKESPSVKKYYAGLARTKAKTELAIKFSSWYFYTSTDSRVLEYKVDDIKENDIFFVCSNNTRLDGFQRILEDLKLVLPSRSIYIGRGTPSGYADAESCKLPNVFTFKSGEFDRLVTIKLVNILSDEEKQNALKHFKGCFLSQMEDKSRPFKGLSFSINTNIGQEHCRSYCLQGFYHSDMQDVLQRVAEELCRAGEHIENAETDSPLSLIGYYLFSMEVENTMRERYPLWDKPSQMMMNYIERMDKDRELQCSGQF